jgi:hypothetical protein
LLLAELVLQLLDGLPLRLTLHQLAHLVVQDDSLVSMRLLHSTRALLAQLVVSNELRGFDLDIDVPRRLADVLAAVDGSGGTVVFFAFGAGGFNDVGGVQLLAGGDG